MVDSEEQTHRKRFFADLKTIIPLGIIIIAVPVAFFLTQQSQDSSSLPNYKVLPTAPSNIKILNIASASADITWVNHADNATFIQLGYLPESSKWTLLKIRPDLTLLELTDIPSHVKYEVKIQACNTIGCSDWVQNSFTTLKPDSQSKKLVPVPNVTFIIKKKK